ncbi:MAG: hypothetical protein JXB49_28550 [Bacteroidales bacterium]|nr:hypothetical protein [Bacteroidales bacterium]
MKNILFILPLFVMTNLFYPGYAGDTLNFNGQLSVYTHFNPKNKLPWWSGARYIPQFTHEYCFSRNRLIDFEASVNMYGNIGWKPSDSSNFDGDMKPYRLWTRYSTQQFELRLGLQKINFGSSSILRPLMWFDQIDPRDPLQLTDGVWGILARYYFLNNANIWLWGLYGNKNLKGWEFLKTEKQIPEFGGRIQIPLPKGEAGFTYHHRTADGGNLPDSVSTSMNFPENRFGLDAKFDMVVGWWVEASWTNFGKNIGLYTNQEIVNLGIDYTFGLGNGLTIIFEQLIASSDINPFEFREAITFSILNLTYPIGLFDNISAIIYYDWKNNKSYNFLNWQRQFNRFTLYLIAYINPEDYIIPAQGSQEILYAGYGLQLMVVLNH